MLRLRRTCSTVSAGVSPGPSSWRMRLSSRKLRAVTKSCRLDAEWLLAEGFPFGGANGSSCLTSQMAPRSVLPGPGAPGERPMETDPPGFRRSVVAIVRRVSVLHPWASQAWNTGKSHASPEERGHCWPLYVPARTPENSPPLQRWDHESLAAKAPTGATETRTVTSVASCQLPRDHGFRRLLPSLAGLDGLVGIAFPPLKRWASARSTLNSGVRLAREGEAPAEPQPPDSVSPGSRLSRSFALPNWLAATPRLSVDDALVRLQACQIGGVRVPVRRLEFDPVADRNCVAARRGGEHREAKGRSETDVNSIRFLVATSLLASGEVDVPHGHAKRDGRASQLGPWLNQSMKHKLKVLLGSEG